MPPIANVDDSRCDSGLVLNAPTLTLNLINPDSSTCLVIADVSEFYET